jgi:hypothetical protein
MSTIALPHILYVKVLSSALKVTFQLYMLPLKDDEYANGKNIIELT